MTKRTELMAPAKVINFTEQTSACLTGKMYFDRKLEDMAMQYLWIATQMKTPFNV